MIRWKGPTLAPLPGRAGKAVLHATPPRILLDISSCCVSVGAMSPDMERMVHDIINDVEIQAGPVLVLTQASTHRPLLSLEDNIRCVVNVTWSRLHLHESYWKSSKDQGLEKALQTLSTHKEELPDLTGALHYVPSIDDVATVIQCRVVSALLGLCYDACMNYV